ncbi:MAG: hypothetical protein IPJ60_15375 [Sphingobacteriaceae bacterium]|nr:hypothetical protein [Sphingobacteriaceae bacterium]
MKLTSLFKAILVLSLLIMSSKVAAQKKGHHHPHKHRHAKKAVVVKRSAYRPTKVVVFHPVWRPKYAYHRRWVYFPKYNLYWDNWRNHYVFLNGPVWVSQAAAPPIIMNVNLENEKSKELKEEEDDTDDIYKDNSAHKEN